VRSAHPRRLAASTGPFFDRDPYEASPSTDFLAKLRHRLQTASEILRWTQENTLSIHPQQLELTSDTFSSQSAYFWSILAIFSTVNTIFQSFSPIFWTYRHVLKHQVTYPNSTTRPPSQLRPVLTFLTHFPLFLVIFDYFHSFSPVFGRINAFSSPTSRPWTLRRASDLIRVHFYSFLSTYFHFRLFQWFPTIFIRFHPFLALSTLSRALRDALDPYYAPLTPILPNSCQAPTFFTQIRLFSPISPIFIRFHSSPVPLTRL
jgi:hypothetical protein